MTRTRRDEVVAEFEIISYDDLIEDPYRQIIVLYRSGRAVSIEELCGDFHQVTREYEQRGDGTPTIEELGAVLVEACQDYDNSCRIRHLSAVVHGMLPLGDHLRDRSTAIPDAIFEASFWFGPCTTYRAEIAPELIAALKRYPAMSWARRVQMPGTVEHTELVQQIQQASPRHQDWLDLCRQSSSAGTGTAFASLIAKVCSVGGASGSPAI